MAQSYLPPYATIAEACEWLQSETGEPWTLARLIEHGLMPWFWLDYEADYKASADVVFCGRKDGYLAPLIFVNDAGRAAIVGKDVRVSMTRNIAGDIVGFPPGSLVRPIDDLRFKRDDITLLASKFSEPAGATAAKVAAVKCGITKNAVIDAFEGVYFDRDQWSKALGKNIPDWLKLCRAEPGKQGDNKTSATWWPVLIAAALLDKGITVNQLDAVFFQSLKYWADEWQEASANDR